MFNLNYINVGGLYNVVLIFDETLKKYEFFPVEHDVTF